MKKLILLLLFLAAFIAAFVAFMPIGAVLRFAGAEARGLTWDQASGTLLEGQLSGLSLNGEALGAATLKLDPGALLRAGVSYDTQWEGPAGRGSGKIGAFAGNEIVFSDFRLELDLAAIKGMADWVRQSGGTIRIRTERVAFRNGVCADAAGTAWSDALVRGGALLGTSLPELNGALACDGDWLLVPLNANAGSGMAVNVTGKVNLLSPGSFEARVTGAIPPDVRLGLPLAGFMPSGSDFVYTYSPATERPVR